MIDTNKVVELLRKEYYSHTTNDLSKSDWEILETHLREVSELCSEYARPLGMGEQGRVAGLLHDIGKYSEKMQSRFEDNTITGVNHWSNGTFLALELGHSLEAFCIQGHHVGLPNLGDLAALGRKMLTPVFYEKTTGFQEPHKSIINKFLKRGMVLPPEIKRGRDYDFETSFQIRMLFSCLVDADRTCTSRFSNTIKGSPNPIDKEYPELQPEKALDVLVKEVTKKSSDTELGKLRNRVLQDCLEKSKLPPGLFTLTVPTGGAKTLSSVAFGLNHARIYDKKKIIYVIPFTTIIDQTGTVLTEDENDSGKLVLNYHKHFGDDYVLEHHSTLEVESDKVETQRVSTMTWKNPFVVTTNVQFFESLFSCKTTPCVKLHNIPNSVLIFDEVQTLPPKMLKALLSGVRILVEKYGCTAIFCSATVPSFENVNLEGMEWNPTEICSNPEGLSSQLKRTDIIIKKRKITHSQLAKRMLKHKQCLCVVNTKHDCRVIFEEIKNVEGSIHLSTSMCSNHRKKVIAEIRQRLKNGLECRVVSTQLIEAGVDVDFPHGFRVFAPLDSIIQVAGRINREGKLKDKKGNLMRGILEVVDLIEGRSPKGTYQTCIDITRGFLFENKKVDFHSPAVYKEYYKRLYEMVGREIDPVFVASDNCQMETISKECKIIDDLTVSVIVPYENGEYYIDLLKNTEEIPKWLYRKLQLVSVNIFRNQIEKMMWDDVVKCISFGDQQIYYWSGEYNEKIGIVYNPLQPGDFVL